MARILVTYPPKWVHLFASWLSRVNYYRTLENTSYVTTDYFTTQSSITTASCFCYVMCPRDRIMVTDHFTTQPFITSLSWMCYVTCKRDHNAINTLKKDRNHAISIYFLFNGRNSWPRFGPFPQILRGCFSNQIFYRFIGYSTR